MLRALALATLMTSVALPAMAAPDVVVSIKPIHSLVAAIMKGVGEPSVLVGGNASPHTYQMKPSQAAALQEADLIIWTGHGLEHFLEKPLESLGGKAMVIEIDETAGLTRLTPREGGNFDAHQHEEEGHDHAKEEEGHDHAKEEEGHDHAAGDDHDHEGEVDMHLWLDTGNAKTMAGVIEAALAKVDPANAATYAANRAELDGRLDALETEIRATVEPVKAKPVIVFHDAYQYFERQFGITVVGSVTVNPEVQPGAARIAEIRDKITRLEAACVFTEPQFEPKVVSMLVDGTKAGIGQLDPEAGALTEGPDLYFELMRGIAGNLVTCLKDR